MNLTPGRCFLNIVFYRGTAMADHVQNAAYFDIEPEDIYGSGRIPPRGWVVGLLQHQWSFGEKEAPRERITSGEMQFHTQTARTAGGGTFRGAGAS